VYQTEVDKYDDTDYPLDDIYDSVYEAYYIDTDILQILVNITNTNCSKNNGTLIKRKQHYFQEMSGKN
jgi:hypothetical protein